MYIVNPDTSLAERIQRFTNHRWQVRTDFVKTTGIPDLVEHLCSKARSETWPRNEQVPWTQVRSRVRKKLQSGDSFRGRPAGDFKVVKLDQDAIYIEEAHRRIPYQLTWNAIASVVQHLLSDRLSVPIGGRLHAPPQSSIDALMKDWYARHCGNAVAGLLVAAEISDCALGVCRR